MRLTLRAQIALATGIVVLIVVAVAGAVIALRIDHRDRAMVDRQLAARVDRVFTDLDKLLANTNTSTPPGADGYGDLLDDSESLVRLLDGDQVLAQRGAIPNEPIPAPASDGLMTVTVDGTPWRSYVRTDSNDVRVQVLQSLVPINDRFAANTRLVILVTLFAAAGSGVAGWLVGNTMLRPLHRLTTGAVAITDDPDPTHRLPAVDRPAEIAALSTTLNGMLDRLGASAETTRRFAADVGHELRGPLSVSGTYLETLLSSPNLPEDARRSVAASHEQQQRMVATLAALQALARADAGARPAPAEIEVGVLVDELVRLSRHRHPDVRYRLNDASDGATLWGWRDGLRIAIDNLLENAAIHGRPNGQVDVRITTTGDIIRIVVDDDGPGIPPDQRDHLRRRFARGPDASKPGSGLGLAIVEQQAALHGGDLVLRTSATGGLRAELALTGQTVNEPNAEPPAGRAG